MGVAQRGVNTFAYVTIFLVILCCSHDPVKAQGAQVCNDKDFHCQQTCFQTNCSMNCGPDTASCNQRCATGGCLEEICHSKDMCTQTCMATACPDLECHSPIGCYLSISQSGSGYEKALCAKEDAYCQLLCDNAECNLMANSREVKTHCSKANCTVKLNHPSVNGTISCKQGDCTVTVMGTMATVAVTCETNATCLVKKQVDAVATCAGEGRCRFLIISPAVAPTLQPPKTCSTVPQPQDCQHTCSNALAPCAQRCATSGCRMECGVNTRQCTQQCTGKECAAAICRSQDSCSQMCNASSSCYKMECHSPKLCTFVVPSKQERPSEFLCQESSARCDLACQNSKCTFRANGVNSTVTCLSSQCIITYNNVKATANILCEPGSTCSVTSHASANVMCSGPNCHMIYHPTSASEQASLSLSLAFIAVVIHVVGLL